MSDNTLLDFGGSGTQSERMLSSSATLLIRKATLADLPDLVDLIEAQVNEHPLADLFMGTQGNLAAFATKVLELGVFYLAFTYAQGRPSGVLGVVALPHHLSGEVYAHEVAFYVRPANRGGSVMHRLVSSIQEWACMKSIRVLQMRAPYGVAGLEAYYMRQGFKPVETAFIKEIT